MTSKAGSRAIFSGCFPRHKNLIGDQFILGAEENILIKGYIEIRDVKLETNWPEHALKEGIW